MPIARGLHYLKREGFLSFCRRFLIFATLEWWSKFLLFFKYLGKSSPVIREIQGSRMRLSFKDKGVSRELTLVDIREPLLTRTVQGELKEGLCVLDIGANIGYYALMEASRVGESGQVYAVEPVPHNMQVLEDNIGLNDYRNIETFNQAMGDSDSTLSMYISDHPNWCSFYPSGSVIGQIEVPVSRLDTFLQGKRRPDIIRMDVEGYEYEIFSGMPELLASGAPLRLFIEFHPDIMGRERAVEFVGILKKHGFVLKKVILEPNVYPPCSWLAWRLVDCFNKNLLKMKFGAWEMTLDDLIASEPIMTGKAGDPGLFLVRDGQAAG